MRSLGTGEIILILLIVLLIFGPGRIIKVAKELGKSIKIFRNELGDEKEADADQEEDSESESKK